MNWFTWRQHRKQFLVFGLLLGLYALIVIPTGLHFWHVYRQALSNCDSFATASDPQGTCDQLSNQLFQSKVDITLRLLPIVVLFVPALLGIFLGAPLLAREYGEGTNKLAWTQSISRKKWLNTKLAWMIIGAAIVAAGFTALSTFWERPFNYLFLNRFNTGPFAVQGIVPVACTIFIVSTGIAAGAWLRRTMAALGVTLAVFIVVGLIAIPSFVRPYYMKSITATSLLGPDQSDSQIPAGAWVLSRQVVDKNGTTFNPFDSASVPSQCRSLTQNVRVSESSQAAHVKAAGGDALDDCLNTAGYRQVAKYQPASRYWDFQQIETGVYLALSLIPIGATYWLVLKRDA
jgi:ABC-type transport system involved in multi-copper enzyme maturation permease subunit